MGQKRLDLNLQSGEKGGRKACFRGLRDASGALKSHGKEDSWPQFLHKTGGLCNFFRNSFGLFCAVFRAFGERCGNFLELQYVDNQYCVVSLLKGQEVAVCPLKRQPHEVGEFACSRLRGWKVAKYERQAVPKNRTLGGCRNYPSMQMELHKRAPSQEGELCLTVGT